jgi:transposase
VNPVDSLADVLLRVQTHPASKIDELLPHNWSSSKDLTSCASSERLSLS